ncbi:Transcription factor, K-box [Dillenia turbinata]|uniref:Transcription factor, K-box n=1 Tax=Dillenia turbinata TaxID=194707 RepID=A0AAN8USS4_9MAGN
MKETIERYQKHMKEVQTDDQLAEENMQHLKHEAASMTKKIEQLELAKRKLLGEGIASCSIEELQQIENQLEKSVSCIRFRKTQVFNEQIVQLKEKEKNLLAENAVLIEKCGMKPKERSNERNETTPIEESTPTSDVETELFIGPPPQKRDTIRMFPHK